jgi:hypothetical protein
VSPSDYILNLLLVAVVVRQIRGKRLTPLGLLWPLGLVMLAAVEYLRAIPSGGNDLALVLGGALVGTVLGCGCGWATRIELRPHRSLWARASGLAAVLWVLGIGGRMGFALYAENGGGPSVSQFSATHGITGAAAWTACFLLMSLAEVLGRTAILAARARARARTARTRTDASAGTQARVTGSRKRLGHEAHT